jgi:FkbM family methyltransferase
MGVRSALERATHRIVVQRRMPPPFSAARIYVSTEGGLRYLARTMADADPVLLRLAEEVVRPGSTVWDIGANVGLFSFASAVAAGPAGRVLAVEPDPVMARLLRRSAALNTGHAPVEVLPAAVCDELSVARFHVARRNRATNHLDGFGPRQAAGVRTTQLVLTVTLDWLADHFPAPDVIKIDVEEAELPVLAGGARVLRHCPTIICEVAGQNAAAVGELLTAGGYDLYDGDRPPGDRAPVTAAPFNTLAMSPGRTKMAVSHTPELVQMDRQPVSSAQTSAHTGVEGPSSAVREFGDFD